MSEHRILLNWQRTSSDFTYENYNRDHTWSFDGGVTVHASASPAYRGNPACVDPEEALVAALSSCHMLTFLAIASKKKLVVDAYEDDAVGYLEKNAQGKLAITRCTLRPMIRFGGSTVPSAEELKVMHEHSHHECFIANSVLTEVTVEPR
jgi:organic hydroperoxide reductase OsmC/OhrA